MKLPYCLLVLLALICGGCNFSGISYDEDENSAFETAYTEVATAIAATDAKRALIAADSLLKYSDNNLQTMKSLMLIATLKQRSGEIAEALSLGMEAEKIARKEKNYNWQVRIAGFLSTTYRWVNLTSEARKYLQIAEKANAKVKDTPNFSTTQALIHQEKAYYAIEEDEDFEAAILELRQAEDNFSKVSGQRGGHVFHGTTNQLLGDCYFQLQDLNRSEAFYIKSLNDIGEEESQLKLFIFCGLGNVALASKDYKQALHYYKQAQDYMGNQSNFNADVLINKSLSNYYKEVGNQDLSFSYHESYVELLKERNRKAKQVSNQVIQLLRQQEVQAQRSRDMLTLATLVLVAIIVFLLVWSRRLRRQERQKYELIVKNGSVSQPQQIPEPLVHQADHLKRQYAQETIMPKETEERLLKEIGRFESRNVFFQSDLSLSVMASKLNTNTKYLSYIINKHKGKDFNNYVNELRIQKLLKDLQSNPVLWDYKISYLANQYGFSSHSKFANVFKELVGITPSIFIKHLRKDATTTFKQVI